MDFVYLLIGESVSDGCEVIDPIAVFDTEEQANDYCSILECGCSWYDKYKVVKYTLNELKYYYTYTLYRYPLRKKEPERYGIFMSIGEPPENSVGSVITEKDTRKEKIYSTVVLGQQGVSVCDVGNKVIKEFLDEYDDENTITYL